MQYDEDPSGTGQRWKGKGRATGDDEEDDPRRDKARRSDRPPGDGRPKVHRRKKRPAESAVDALIAVMENTSIEDSPQQQPAPDAQKGDSSRASTSKVDIEKDTARANAAFLKASLAVPPTHVEVTWDQNGGIRHRRVSWILSRPELQDFVGGIKSGVLIVNGNEPKTMPHPKAVTCVTSYLMDLVERHKADGKSEDARNSILLGLFCGCQTLPDGGTVVLNLLAQLMEKATVPVVVPHVKSRPPFQRLLDILTFNIKAQLRRSTVYVLLDCISACEEGSQAAETMAIFKALHEISQDAPGPLFKVVITSANGGEVIKDAVSKKLPRVMAPTVLPKTTEPLGLIRWSNDQR